MEIVFWKIAYIFQDYFFGIHSNIPVFGLPGINLEILRRHFVFFSEFHVTSYLDFCYGRIKMVTNNL